MWLHDMSPTEQLMWLRVILGGGGAQPVWTTVSGVSPLSLLNAVAKEIRSLIQFGKCTQPPGVWNTAITQEGKCEQPAKEYLDTITQEGKCVQNGTPSPDAPVDIVCNNGAIKFSANMANVNEQTANVGYYISSQGVVTADSYNWIYQAFIPVTPSTTYTLSISQSVYYVSISEYSTAEDSGFVVRKTGSTGSNTSLTITTGATTNFIRFGTNLDRTVVTLNKVLAINWMLNEGGTAIPYAPYAEGSIYTDGTPEVLAVSWNNLFNASSYTEINAYVNANTGVLTTGSPGSMTQYCAVIPCKPNTQYNITGQGTSAWGAFTSDSIGTTATAFGKGGLLTTGANDRYLIGLVRANGDSIDYRSTLAVQEAQTVPVPMLLGVGDYKDTAEFIQGVKTGKVGVKVFDGTEEWSRSAYTGVYLFGPSDMKACNPPIVGVSTHFRGSSAATSSMPDLSIKNTYRDGGNAVLCVKYNGFSAITDFTAWLAAQYAAGTPVIALYPLAIETTEQISDKITYRNTDAQISYTAEVSDITITTTQSEKSTPAPDTPLDIVCNNGKLAWNGTAVVADGTPEVLTIGGINLLDPSTSNIVIGQAYQQAGSSVSSINNWRAGLIPIEGGKTYAFWGRKKSDNAISAYNRINWYTADETNISPRPSYTVNTVTVATAPSNAAFVGLSCSCYDSVAAITRDTFDKFNWMFAEASAEIPYQPYITPQTITDIPMLLAVGDYKDEAEIINGLLTHKIGVKVFDGTENISKVGNCFQYTVSGKMIGKAGLFCTHFQYSTATSSAVADLCAMEYNSAIIGFRYDACADAASFKSYLAAQYAAGTPVIVVYPLATQTTESITAYPQLCNKLYNTADVTAEVDDISVTFTTGAQTVPSPYSQLPIKCNNGELKWNGTSVVADGTPEVLKIIGQNLVDLSAVTDGYYYDPSGVYTPIAVARLTDYISVKAGQTYTVYVKAQLGGVSANVRCNLFNSAKEWKSQSSFAVNSGAAAVSTITPIENGFLRVSANYSGTGAKVDWSTLQIVVGEYTLSTMPSYQPYAAQTASVENLLAVGDYKDTQEIISGIKTGKIGVKVLTGAPSEQWTYISSQSVYISLTGAETPQLGAVLCTHLDGKSSPPLPADRIGTCFVGMSGGRARIFCCFPGVESEADVRALFATQYAAGTPVIVIYPLATETTESVIPQPLHTTAGTNTVSVEAEVDGIELSVEYAASA